MDMRLDFVGYMSALPEHTTLVAATFIQRHDRLVR